MPDPTSLSCLRRYLAIALASACAASFAFAQSTDAPARIVVGFPAGGSADAVARLLTEKLAVQLGRPVIVDNRPGAGGRIAAASLKSAPSDGSVVMLAPEALTVTNPLVFRKLAYAVSDLAPISMVAEFPYVLAASSAAGAKTLPDFVKWARQSPERASFGSPAAGSPLHFFGLLVGQVTQLPMVVHPWSQPWRVATFRQASILWATCWKCTAAARSRCWPYPAASARRCFRMCRLLRRAATQERR
jgi:tripartite-type tricarboxylate transporter receptor subunit TctC